MEKNETFSNVTHYTHVDVQPGGINIQHVENLYQADLMNKGEGSGLSDNQMNGLTAKGQGANLDELSVEEDTATTAEAKREPLAPLKLNDDTEGMKEALKPFFKPAFYGVGGARVDHLNYLVSDLRTLSTQKEVATLALMIHNSSSFKSNAERTFTRWYRKFCDIVHSPHLKCLRPSRLAPTEAMKSTFSYL